MRTLFLSVFLTGCWTSAPSSTEPVIVHRPDTGSFAPTEGTDADGLVTLAGDVGPARLEDTSSFYGGWDVEAEAR